MTSRRFFRFSAVAAAFLTCSSLAYGGLDRMRSTSVVVIYATEEGGRARDCADTDCKSGPVAKAIESALKTPRMTIAALFDAVNADVAATTHLSQKPRIEASQAINVPFVKNPEKASALVIGNGAYANLSRLESPPRDAEIVAKVLAEVGFRTAD